MKELALEMIRPWAERRIAQPRLPLGDREAVKMTFPQLAIISISPGPEQLPKHKRCRICPYSRDRKTKSVPSATNLCARIMPCLCEYALTAILQVRQVASFHSQHGICVVLFMLIANNHVWFVKKHYKHCDLSHSEFFLKIYLLLSAERCF